MIIICWVWPVCQLSSGANNTGLVDHEVCNFGYRRHSTVACAIKPIVLVDRRHWRSWGSSQDEIEHINYLGCSNPANLMWGSILKKGCIQSGLSSLKKDPGSCVMLVVWVSICRKERAKPKLIETVFSYSQLVWASVCARKKGLFKPKEIRGAEWGN